MGGGCTVKSRVCILWSDRPPRPAPAVVMLAGGASVAAAVLPADRASGTRSDEPAEGSWQARMHDRAAPATFLLLGLAPLLLARRLRSGPEWAAVRPALAPAGWTVLLLASVLRARRAAGRQRWNGLLQRVLIYSAIGWVEIVAVRLFRLAARAHPQF